MVPSIADRVKRIKSNPDYGLDDDSPVGIRGSARWSCKAETDSGKRDIVWTANTADVDADDEIVLPGGASLDYFGINKSVFVDHSYDVRSCIGKARTISPVKEGNEITAWRVRAHIASTPLGEDILTMAKEIGIGCSIGFLADSYGPPSEEEQAKYGKASSIVRKWRWLELSATAFPCNVACQSLQGGEAKAIGELDRLVTKSLISRDTARMLGMPDERPKYRGTTIVIVK